MSRLAALVGKEMADLRRNPTLFFPAVLTGTVSTVLPFVIAIAIPYFSGERLADSSDFRVAIELASREPGGRALDPEGAVQAWIFQQFLIFLVLAPAASAMSVASYSVIGEKQARTLEPLLATPITTLELLSAKVLSALLPAFALSAVNFVVYALGVWLLARPGVVMILLAPRSLAIVFLLGPLAALTALQLAVCVSSRVNDARTAQQIGALVILPIAGLLVAQLVGSFVLTLATIGAIVLGLLAINAGLMRLGIAIFDRESILTRWR